MRPAVNLKVVVALVFIVVLLFGGWLFLSDHYFSMGKIMITFKNSSNLEIRKAGAGEGHPIDADSSKIVATIKNSGEYVSLKKGVEYTVSYKGSSGFESGELSFRIPEDKNINIDPYFSRDKLDSQLKDELPAIQQIIKNKYKNVRLFEIQRGKLYNWADWYATTLEYTGKDIYNSDTLRIVLKKENGSWSIKTDPPDITLSKYLYPDIPEDVLRDVNNFQ